MVWNTFVKELPLRYVRAASNKYCPHCVDSYMYTVILNLTSDEPILREGR